MNISWLTKTLNLLALGSISSHREKGVLLLLVAPALSILLYFIAKTGSGGILKDHLISTNWTPTSTNIPIEEIGTSLIVEVAEG